MHLENARIVPVLVFVWHSKIARLFFSFYVYFYMKSVFRLRLWVIEIHTKPQGHKLNWFLFWIGRFCERKKIRIFSGDLWTHRMWVYSVSEKLFELRSKSICVNSLIFRLHNKCSAKAFIFPIFITSLNTVKSLFVKKIYRTDTNNNCTFCNNRTHLITALFGAKNWILSF